MIMNPEPRESDLREDHTFDAAVRRYYWQPGNMTGYYLVVAKVSMDEVLVAWTSKGVGIAGPAMIFDLREQYGAGYVEAKMDIAAKDAVAICQFLRYEYPRFQFSA